MTSTHPVPERSLESHGRISILPPRIFAGLAAIVVYIGLFANQAQARQLAAGVRVDATLATAGAWQYSREAITLALVVVLGFASSGRAVGGRGSTVGRFAVGYAVVAAIVTMVSGTLAVTDVLFGLRFVYVALLVTYIRRYAMNERAVLLRTLSSLLVPFLLIEAYIAYGQIRSGPPTLGSTNFGSRPWGTYSSSDNLGLAILSVGAILLVATGVRFRAAWIFLAVAVCISTGSRTAILGVALILIGAAAARWKKRIVAIPFGLVILFGLYTVASTQAFSGRELNGSEARFATWGTALNSLHNAGQYIFGRGIGFGTNSLVATVGTNGTAVKYTDSVLIASILSLGIVGVALCLVWYTWLVRTITFERRLTLIPVLTIAALSFNVTEVSPFNLLILIALGCSTSVQTPRQEPIVGGVPKRSQFRPTHVVREKTLVVS